MIRFYSAKTEEQGDVGRAVGKVAAERDCMG
jgi:hypothetical protein